MGQVGQHGAAGPDGGNGGQRFLQAHVRGVQMITQSVNNQQIHSFHPLQGRGRDAFHIRHVNQAPAFRFQEIGICLHPGMEHRKGRRQHVPHTERSRHLVRLRPDVPAPPRFRNERPAVHGPQGVHRHGRSIHGQAAGPAPAEGAQIVKTSHVVHMGMRIKNGIHIRDIFPQGLLPQIRGRIQQEAGASGLHIN